MALSQTFPALKALHALVLAAAPSGVPVYFGPQPALPTSFEYIVVGCNDTTAITGRQVAVEGDSDWSTFGKKRGETFVIHNSYVGWTGDTDISGLCDRASTTIGLIETALRTDQTVNADGMANGLKITQIDVDPNASGPVLHVSFDVLFSSYNI